jgi:hypothetical protein
VIDTPETRRSAILSILAYHGWMADDGTDRFDARLLGALYWLPLMACCR